MWVDLLVDLGFKKDVYELVLVVLKLIFISVVAVALGINRELHQKPVGVRTLAVIGLTSCLLTIISYESALEMASHVTTGAIPDPMRLTAQIVSGVGFLGAGVIFVKRNMAVSGLTTAAMIWGVAGLGIAVGAGYGIEVIVSLILILVSVEILPNTLGRFGMGKKKKVMLKIKLNDDSELTVMLKNLKSFGMFIRDVNIKREHELFVLDVIVSVPDEMYVTDIYKYVCEFSSVHSVEVRQ